MLSLSRFGRMEGLRSRAKSRASAFGSLPRELLQRIYTQPVLEAQDRLRALAVCKWWGSSLAGLPFASLTITGVGQTEQKFEKRLQWVIAKQPAIVDLKLERTERMFWDLEGQLASQALHSVNRQALRKLCCSVVAHRLCLPGPDVFPGLESLILGSQPVGPDWLRCLPRLKHLTYLSLRVFFWKAENGVLSFPAVPSLCELSLCLCSPGSLVAPWGDMPALRKLELTSGYRGSIDLSACGTGLLQLEALDLSMPRGEAQVDFALLPALKVATLWCQELEGAATVQQAASLTRLYFESGDISAQLCRPWLVELVRSAPPCLRQLGLKGRWTAQLADAVARMQQLCILTVENGRDVLQLPAGPLWQQLQGLCWVSYSPLPLTGAQPRGDSGCHGGADQAGRLSSCQALRGAPQLQTVLTPLWGFRDLHLLLTFPRLKHLTIVKGEDEEVEQHYASLEVLRLALPSLASLESLDLDSLINGELPSFALPG